MKPSAFLATLAALSCTSAAFGQASYTPLGYAENFNSIGPAATTPPPGWKHLAAAVGSNSTWVGTIPASGANSVAAFAVATASTTLAITTTPAGSNNNGFNAARDPGAPADRVLATSPTSIAGVFLQLQLTNDSGAPIPAGFQLFVSFDIVRYTNVATANELPGYWLFVSADAGATWSNVGPNPSIITVPNSNGISSTSLLATLPGAWIPGASLYFRWVDDNAVQTGPDQIIGLNNVAIAPSAAPVNGKCCVSDGSCTLTDFASCTGAFTAAGICTPNTCPPPLLGSCCAADGSCSIIIEADCPTLWTLAQSCAPNICPGAPGACCAADGTCSILPDDLCAGFYVPGTCIPFLCRQPGVTRCIAFGDYGVDNPNQLAVAVRMKAFNPQFLVTTGDNTYSATANISNYDNTQAKYYREFIKITNPASAYFGQGAPVNNFFPVMGNHDFDIGGGAATSIPYWNAYWELPGNERSYTFSQGPIDFFMLSSDFREPESNAPGGPQHAWFLSAYSASTAPYKLVVFHHPAQTSNSGHGPDATMRTWNFQNLPGITAVLSGHNHHLERLEFGGIPWFVSGSGGNSLYSFGAVDPNSVFRNDTHWGFLLIDAGPFGIAFRFVSAAGQILDTRTIIATGACCRGSSCTVGLATACTGPNTRFAGANTACNAPANNTSPCCRADFNQSGAVTVADIFDFLAGWFSVHPSADFDQSGSNTVTDIFDFLAAWFVGC